MPYHRRHSWLRALFVAATIPACQNSNAPTATGVVMGDSPPPLPPVGGHWNAALLAGRFDRPPPGPESCGIPEFDLDLVQEITLDDEGLRAAHVSGDYGATDLVCSGVDALPLPAPFGDRTRLHLRGGRLKGELIGYCQGSAALSDPCDGTIDLALRLVLPLGRYEIVLYGGQRSEGELAGQFVLRTTGYTPTDIMRGAWQATR